MTWLFAVLMIMGVGDPAVAEDAPGLAMRAGAIAASLPDEPLKSRMEKDLLREKVACLLAECGDIPAARLMSRALWSDYQFSASLVIAVRQAKKGDRRATATAFAEAERLVPGVESSKPDGLRTVLFLSRLARSPAEAGLTTEAGGTWRRAFELLATVQPDPLRGGNTGIRRLPVQQIAIDQALAGDEEAAARLVRTSPLLEARERQDIMTAVFSAVASDLTDRGELRRALAVSRRIGSPIRRAESCQRIAASGLRESSKPEARDAALASAHAANEVRDRYAKTSLLAKAARLLVQAGDREEAEATLARAVAQSSDREPSAAYRLAWAGQAIELAVARQLLGKPDALKSLRQAEEVAARGDEPTHCALISGDIGVAKARMGDVDGALANLKSLIGSVPVAERVLEAAIWNRAARDDLDGAIRVIDAARAEPDFAGTIGDLVETVAYSKAKSGDGRWTLAWTERQSSPTARARALIGAARGKLARRDGQAGVR